MAQIVPTPEIQKIYEGKGRFAKITVKRRRSA
jgi:hypothetical protein